MAVDSSRIGFVLNRKRFLTISALVVGVAGIVLLRTSTREPLYKNEPISYWVDKACRGYDASEAYDARREVKNIGPAAIPCLLKRLNTSDKWLEFRRKIQIRLPEPFRGGVTNLPLPGETRFGAARTLALFGQGAKAAVPDLIRLLPQTDVPAVETLTFIGPQAEEALPALQSLLGGTSNMSRRVQIAGALWHIGHQTNLVLQICTNALAPNSGDDGVNAGAYLTALGRAAAPAVPLALALLQDTNRHEGARANAANILRVAGIHSPEILTALIDSTKPENPVAVRCNCARALRRLDPQYAPLATRLTLQLILASDPRSIQNPPDFARWIKGLELDPDACIPTLSELLQDDSPDMRRAAALAIETLKSPRNLQGK